MLWLIEYYRIPKRRVKDTFGVARSSVHRWLKAVFDRSRPLWRKPGGLLQKAAAAVVVGEGRWGRQEFALQTIYWAAANHGMIVFEPEADVCGVADAPGDIENDEQALTAAANLGRRLATTRLAVE